VYSPAPAVTTPLPPSAWRVGWRLRLVDAALIAIAVAIFEGVRLAQYDIGIAAAAILAGCAWSVAAALAVVLLSVPAVVSLLPWPASWRQQWAHRGALVQWRIALLALCLGALGLAAYQGVARSHDRFRFLDAGPVALVLAALVMLAAVVIGAVAVLADHLVTGWLQRRLAAVHRDDLTATAASPFADRWALPRSTWVTAGLAATAVAVLPVVVVRVTVPALQLASVATFALLVALVLFAHLTAIGRYKTARGLALLAMLASFAGIAASTRSEPARGAAVATGVLSNVALRALWKLGDRDGDGYVGAFLGGADCDDGNALRNPAATEFAGDGIDDNCTGADGTPERLRARLVAPAAAPAASTAARPNIVLLSIDALRADHLGAWGYPRPTSPHLDALAARSTRFAWAMTSCPSTRCAIPSLLTGRYASTFVRSPPSTLPTLAGELQAAGWETATITCCDRFADTSVELTGFATVDTSADSTRLRRPGQSNSDMVVERAVRWLNRRGEAKPSTTPFFLWMHLYDPHHPYLAPEDARGFGDRDIDRYDAEIRFADLQVGRLLAEFDRLGLSSSTIIVIVADHGDEFGEHGIRFHARSMFNQVVRIPMIVHLPGSASTIAAPRVEKAPVSLVDVMPTVLELAGVPLPAGMNGRSLAAAVRGDGPAPDRPVLIELVPDHQISRDLAAVAWRQWKVIWDRQANSWSLYSLSKDPADAHNLAADADKLSADRADQDPSSFAEMKRMLGQSLDAELGALPPAPAPTSGR
jgi:choline-sulfatase